MKQIKVCIKTMEPVILTSKNNTTIMTATNDYFSGTIVRGVIANEYININKLGKNAHENNDFIELFFDKLRFTDANLEDVITGKRSFKLPISLQKNKEGTDLIDLINPEAEFPGAGYKGLKNFGVLTDDNQIRIVDIKKNISFHMSRSNVGGGDQSERLAGRSIDGSIYNYESINPNQKFVGYIYGEEAYLNKLVKNFDSQWYFFAGRSSGTQYGKCLINIGKVEDISNDELFSIKQGFEGNLYIRLDSNMLSASGEFYNAEVVLSQLTDKLKAVSGATFKIFTNNGRLFANKVNIDGFVNIWGMKRPREEALAAGSVFILNKNGKWTIDEINCLNNIIYSGIGPRYEEGFGQLRPWRTESALKLYNEKVVNNNIDLEYRISNKYVIEKAKEIINVRVMEMIRMIAADDAELAIKTSSMLEGSAQFLQRMDDLLENRKNASWQGMHDRLIGSIGDSAQKVFNERLRNIRIFCDNDIQTRGYSLYEIFIDNTVNKYPYIERLKYEVSKNGMIKAMEYLSVSDEIFENSEFFYEYWHWFFRHCRKLASRKNGE